VTKIFPSDRKHISHSSLNMFLKCGVQYDFRYNRGVIIAPNAVVVRGSCGHKTLEKNFIQKIETHLDLPEDQVKDIFSDEWEESKYSIAWSKKDLDGNSVKKASGIIKDQGIEMVKVFHKEQSPRSQPFAVEQPFEIRFEKGYPDLVGIIDRIDIEDEGYAIGDVKFVSKSPQEDDLKTDIQMTIYSAGYLTKYGSLPKLKKQFAIATKVPKTKILEEPPRDQNTINRLLWRLEAAFDALENGIFTPAPAGAWWCSEGWCGYWEMCKYRP